MRIATAKGELTNDDDVTRFLALAIAGEAGELANIVKKSWRGDGWDLVAATNEIADIRIYLEHLSRHLKIDLDEACEAKLALVEKRLLTKEGR